MICRGGLTVPFIVSTLLARTAAGFFAQPLKTSVASFSSGAFSRSSPKLSLWKIFGGAGGIDYSKLRGMASTEAAELALQGKVAATSKDGYSIATFAGGCFWGIELAYQRVPGVVDTLVGYTQGTVEKPTYEQICYADTGHTEGIQVFYDPKECSYETLCKVVLGRIDPTLKNQVGNDRGPQYRHGIYYHTEEQKAKAEAVLAEVQTKYNKPIVTELKPAAVFWPAEEYHQQYLAKGGRFNAPQSAAKNCNDPIRCYG